MISSRQLGQTLVSLDLEPPKAHILKVLGYVRSHVGYFIALFLGQCNFLEDTLPDT